MMTRRAYWLCQLSGWTIYSLINYLFAAMFAHPGQISWSWSFSAIYFSAAGVVLTHLMRWWIRRAGWLDLPLGKLLVRVLAWSALFGVSMSVATMLLWLFSKQRPGDQQIAGVLVVMLFNFSIVGLLWQVIYFGVHYFERYQRQKISGLKLELAAQEAHLQALRSQMNPHFLFNCLNSLRGLIAEDPRAAQEMVTRLSSLLRHVLQSDRVRTVPLAVELEAVEHYLALERIRFEERLRTEFAVETGVTGAAIPPMLLETLVENAVKHGIAMLPGGGVLRVAVRSSGAMLEIEVFNDGRLVAASGGTQVGLENVRRRLALLYGDRASMTLTEEAGGVMARVLLPRTVAEEAA
jgi:LytS/YehU family sensor histidine kinase